MNAMDAEYRAYQYLDVITRSLTRITANVWAMHGTLGGIGEMMAQLEQVIGMYPSDHQISAWGAIQSVGEMQADTPEDVVRENFLKAINRLNRLLNMIKEGR